MRRTTALFFSTDLSVSFRCPVYGSTLTRGRPAAHSRILPFLLRRLAAQERVCLPDASPRLAATISPKRSVEEREEAWEYRGGTRAGVRGGASDLRRGARRAGALAAGGGKKKGGPPPPRPTRPHPRAPPQPD